MEEKGRRTGKHPGAGRPATEEGLLSRAEKDMALYGMLTVRTLDAVREAGFRYEAGALLSLEELAGEGSRNKGGYPEVYRLSLGEAKSRGELARFHASEVLDRCCRLGMDSKISSQLGREGRLKPGCLDGLLAEYGPDRVGWILAHTIHEHRGSPEISQKNREWAESFHVPRNDPVGGSLWLGCVMRCPAAAVEEAAGMVREAWLRQASRTEDSRERPRQSVLERLAAGAPQGAGRIRVRKVAERGAR